MLRLQYVYAGGGGGGGGGCNKYRTAVSTQQWDT